MFQPARQSRGVKNHNTIWGKLITAINLPQSVLLFLITYSMKVMQTETCNIKYHISEEIWVLINRSTVFLHLIYMSYNGMYKLKTTPPPPKQNLLMSLYK
jgi:hypothetical protein